jgi:predicted  nucleic acid-binding Zn-ribbon protein
MLVLAFGSKGEAPRELDALLEGVRSLVDEHGALADEHAEARRTVENIVHEGREKRLQLGFAVDSLGQDASRAKEEAREASAMLESAKLAEAAFPTRMKALGKDLLFWEGRAAFRDPSADLAAAYAALASAQNDWLGARATIAEREKALAAKEARVSDIDFQIRELRAVLAKVEEAVDDEREVEEARARALGERVETLEQSLVAEIQKFCMPLRKRQELRPLFRELESSGAVVS